MRRRRYSPVEIPEKSRVRCRQARAQMQTERRAGFLRHILPFRNIASGIVIDAGIAGFLSLLLQMAHHEDTLIQPERNLRNRVTPPFFKALRIIEKILKIGMFR